MRDWEKLSDLPVITVNYFLMENEIRILVCLAPNSISSTFVYFTPSECGGHCDVLPRCPYFSNDGLTSLDARSTADSDPQLSVSYTYCLDWKEMPCPMSFPIPVANQHMDMKTCPFWPNSANFEGRTPRRVSGGLHWDSITVQLLPFSWVLIPRVPLNKLSAF